jgi:hypothetical protein
MVPPTHITAPEAMSADGEKPAQHSRHRTLWPDERERQNSVLEAVYERPFEDAEQEWRRVLGEMGLQLWHYIAARLVIDSGAWRDKACPYGYVATITRRKAKRLRLADGEARELQLHQVGERSTEESIDYLALDLSKDKNGVWKARTPNDDPYGSSLIDSVEPQWHRPNGEPGFDVDWGAVGQAAGLDDIEAEILECRSLGLTRSALLDSCQNEAERLEFQAGWKRLSRKMVRVKAVLQAHEE